MFPWESVDLQQWVLNFFHYLWMNIVATAIAIGLVPLVFSAGAVLGLLFSIGDARDWADDVKIRRTGSFLVFPLYHTIPIPRQALLLATGWFLIWALITVLVNSFSALCFGLGVLLGTYAAWGIGAAIKAKRSRK